jgi:hypothetical protein
MGILFFGPFNPFHYSPLPLYLPSPSFKQLSLHILTSLPSSDVMQYYWCAIILFSFPSFPKCRRVIPLLQTCSTYEFVYDHSCLCVYVDLSSTYERNMQPLPFWAWLTSPNMMSSNCTLSILKQPPSYVCCLWAQLLLSVWALKRSRTSCTKEALPQPPWVVPGCWVPSLLSTHTLPCT